MEFSPRSEHELASIGDDELIAHAADAREAGDRDQAKLAMGILCHRRYDNVLRRVRIKVPEADAEDVAMEAITTAITSALDGRSVGEFVNWLGTIVARRIADYHRRPGLDTTALPEEHEGEEDVWGSAGEVPDTTTSVFASEAIKSAYSRLSDPHKSVIDLHVFGDRDAQETADEVNIMYGAKLNPQMSAQNVHKISSRFLKDVRGLLEGGD